MGKNIILSTFEKMMTLTLVVFFSLNFLPNSINSVLSGLINKSQATTYNLDASNNGNAEFNQAVAFTLKHEGGLVDDKSDTGGITNYGISYTFLHSLLVQEPKYLSLFSLTSVSQISPSIIKNLTKQQAIQIYNSQWWQKYHYGNLHNQAIATKAFDYSVNMGSVPAIKLLQLACIDEAKSSGVTVNGQLDNSTIAYINNLSSSQVNKLLYTYENVACNYYANIAKAHPADKKFLSGWLQRSNDNSSLYA